MDQSAPGHVGTGRATARSCVRRVEDFIREHYARRLTLADMAEVAGLSPFHFLRVFVEEVGVTPYQYLLNVRITEAARMLTEGSSISQAAYGTGFADQSHLTRRFKRQLGVTPGRYAGRRPATCRCC